MIVWYKVPLNVPSTPGILSENKISFVVVDVIPSHLMIPFESYVVSEGRSIKLTKLPSENLMDSL